jgi:hypothetical protein
MTMVWMLVVALLVWAGVFGFVFALEARVKALEAKLVKVRQENRQ